MKRFIFSLLLVMLIAGAFGYVWISDGAYRETASSSNVPKEFVVAKGDNFWTIGDKLEEEGLIRNKLFVYYFVWKEKLNGKAQAGEYEIAPNMKISEIMDLITNGKVVSKLVKITIPEGFSNKKIIERLREKKPEMADEFASYINCKCIGQSQCVCDPFSSKFSFLQGMPAGIDMEGYLFPDTYFIYEDDTPEKLVEKFLNNFKLHVDAALLAEIERQGKTLHEVVTMASIVEREVGKAEDRKMVAGIFWNRYDIGMPLQSDATVAYALGVDKIKYNLDEIKTNSPYNTYANRGLPPGPIANPGIESIKATISPQESDYIYFLSNPSTGETVFAKTLEEHVNNKNNHGL